MTKKKKESDFVAFNKSVVTDMKKRKKKDKVQKPQRTLKRIWVHESSHFAVIHINNGTEGYDYFLRYFPDVKKYRVEKLAQPFTNYWVSLEFKTCNCESFKQSQRDNYLQSDKSMCIDHKAPTCKHIDALLKMRSM